MMGSFEAQGEVKLLASNSENLPNRKLFLSLEMTELDAFKPRNNPILLSDLPNSTESLSQQVGNTDRATHSYERDLAVFPCSRPNFSIKLTIKISFSFCSCELGFFFSSSYP